MKYHCTVTQVHEITVEIDTEKLVASAVERHDRHRHEKPAESTLDWFLREWPKTFYPIHTLGEHAGHIARMQARRIYDMQANPDVFVEGYGQIDKAGIRILGVVEQGPEVEVEPIE